MFPAGQYQQAEYIVQMDVMIAESYPRPQRQRDFTRTR